MQYTGFIPQLEPVGWGHQTPLLGGESPSVHVLQCVYKYIGFFKNKNVNRI